MKRFFNYLSGIFCISGAFLIFMFKFLGEFLEPMTYGAFGDIFTIIELLVAIALITLNFIAIFRQMKNKKINVLKIVCLILVLFPTFMSVGSTFANLDGYAYFYHSLLISILLIISIIFYILSFIIKDNNIETKDNLNHKYNKFGLILGIVGMIAAPIMLIFGISSLAQGIASFRGKNAFWQSAVEDLLTYDIFIHGSMGGSGVRLIMLCILLIIALLTIAFSIILLIKKKKTLFIINIIFNLVVTSFFAMTAICYNGPIAAIYVIILLINIVSLTYTVKDLKQL